MTRCIQVWVNFELKSALTLFCGSPGERVYLASPDTQTQQDKGELMVALPSVGAAGLSGAPGVLLPSGADGSFRL